MSSDSFIENSVSFCVMSVKRYRMLLLEIDKLTLSASQDSFTFMTSCQSVSSLAQHMLVASLESSLSTQMSS